MYYYEKDYIMRLIHGIARVLMKLLYGYEAEDGDGAIVLKEQEARENNDYLAGMIDAGQVNEAEEKLFDLLESVGWERREKASLAIAFYDRLNSKDDAFLEAADFSREEIIRGLEDALRLAEMEIPEYLRIG
jgi:hypothetical protein